MTLKTYLPIAATVVLMAACSNKNCDKTCTDTKDCTDKTVTYTGTLPAADAAGIECTLQLTYDNDKKTEGDYVLTERYLTETPQTFTYKGDFTIHKGTTESADKAYIKLTPDHPDRATDLASSSDMVRYFLVDNDSTITMTDASLKPAESGLNYSLTAK